MAHCPPELLDDLADLLALVRTWAGVVERRPAVFYVRGEPFLHFHLLEGRRRRADVKGRSGWARLDLPRPLPAATRRALLRALGAGHAERQPRPRATRAPASSRPRPERRSPPARAGS